MILDDIVAYKKMQIEKEKEQNPLIDLNIQSGGTRNFKQALCKEGISFIAEIKKASPSKGIIKEDFDPVKIAEIYEKAPVDAVSILTEKNFFMGSDDYIKAAKKVNSKPVLRKDFIVDEYQLFQSKVIGADAVLLIVSVLGDRIPKFYTLAKELGLDVITEVHSEEELDTALNSSCDIIGINNRNLKDFTVTLDTTEKLIKQIPKEIITVSESGIKTPEDIRFLNSIGVNAVLIGETFMRNLDNINSFILNSR
ncbi:MAG: indole-3-glycerol phosphate synthase TrpC [Solirubrobacterales bacterium]